MPERRVIVLSTVCLLEIVGTVFVQRLRALDYEFGEWFEYILEHHRSKAELIGTVCWSIWKSRNEVVWNGNTMRAGTVVNIASAYLTQWQKVQVMGINKPIGPANRAGDIE